VGSIVKDVVRGPWLFLILVLAFRLMFLLLSPDLDVLRRPWHYRLVLHTSRRRKSHPYSYQ